MLRTVFSVALGLLLSISYGQLKKFYSLQSCDGYDTINFSLSAPAGNCVIGCSENEVDPLTIYGNPNLEKVNPSFSALIRDNTYNVNLALEEFKTSSISDGIVFAFMGGNRKFDDNSWQINVSEDKVYKLDLNYGFGMARVDLSGVPVEDLKIRSGGADVIVEYSERKRNKILMDTFMIKVDMGSLIARNIDCSNAENVIANVGFGNATLDFSDAHKNKCKIIASIGAGNLDVFLPKKDVPVIVYMKDSPLCGLKLDPGFEQVEKNVFVNPEYSESANNLLTFNLDVAMGNVSFHYHE